MSYSQPPSYPPAPPGSPSPRSPPQAPARRSKLVVWGIIGGVAAVGMLVLLVVAIRAFQAELAKADPIPGITITIDTGNALDSKGIDHAARAYLNRRLREAGYDQPGREPLSVKVVFEKIGSEQYQFVDKIVSADKVRLHVAFHDAAGKHLRTFTAQPKMHRQEEFKYDPEIELNKAAYGRAVSQILKINWPPPANLREY